MKLVCIWLLAILSYAGVCSSLLTDNIEKIRNPFIFSRKKKRQASRSDQLVLMGIVSCCKKKCAVLSCGDESCVVEKGQVFQGYKLAYIGENFITINKGKRKKKLYLE